jgi:hypothetical protein
VSDSRNTAIVSGERFPFGNRRIRQSDPAIVKGAEYVLFDGSAQRADQSDICHVNESDDVTVIPMDSGSINNGRKPGNAVD